MIILIGSANIQHLIQVQYKEKKEEKRKKRKNNLFLWWGLRINFLNNFLIYHTAVLIVTMLCIDTPKSES